MKKSKKSVKKTKEKVKKTNVRSMTRHAGLKPHLNLKTRYEEIMDVLTYADKLNPKEKEWLSNFVDEYIGANFNHKGKILHKTKALRKSCYDRNNARNRDILTTAKASGHATVFSALSEKDQAQDQVDRLVDELDVKRNLEAWDDKD